MALLHTRSATLEVTVFVDFALWKGLLKLLEITGAQALWLNEYQKWIKPQTVLTSADNQSAQLWRLLKLF